MKTTYFSQPLKRHNININWKPYWLLLGFLCLLTWQASAQTSSCSTVNAVQWRDLVFVTVNADNSLSPTSGCFLSGAASENMIEANQNGWIEWTAGPLGSQYTIGLSYTNKDAGYTSIAYGILYSNNGGYSWQESGVGVSSGTFLQPSDVLRIERVGSQLRYLLNGVVKRSVAVDASKRMLVDVSACFGKIPVINASFCVPVKATAAIVASSCGGSDGSITLTTYGGTTPYNYTYQWSDGATTANRTGLASGTYSVTVSETTSGGSISYSYEVGNKIQWRDQYNVTENTPNNTLTKPSSVANGWGNSGAASENALEANIDGWIEWTGTPNNGIIGLSFVNADPGSNTIDYAITTPGASTINLVERGGTVSNFAGIFSTDVLRIERKTVAGVSQIRYLKNGMVLRSVTTSASKRLLADVSIYASGATLQAIRSSFCVPVKATATIVGSNCGGSDGSITLSPYGGTAPYNYTYQWSDGVTTANRTGLSAGTYSVTVSETTSGGSISYSYDVGQKVQWRDLYGVSVGSDNSLTKTFTDVYWTAGAASENMIEANQNGWVELTGLTGSSVYIVGLSYSNLDANSTSINYQISYSNSQVTFYSQGANLGGFSLLSTDVVRLERVGSSIQYKKNGVVLKTASVDASKRLLVDVSVATGKIPPLSVSFCVPVKATASLLAAGCGLSDGNITLSPYGGTTPYSYAWSDGTTIANRTGLAPGSYSVTVSDASGGSVTYSYTIGRKPQWQDLVGVSVNADNSLSRPSGSGWNAGAASSNMLEANTDGWVEWTADAKGAAYVVGLSFSNPNALFGSIAYGIYHDGAGNIYCLESNLTQTNLTADKATNLFRIERLGTTLRYLKNGVVVRTMTVDATKRMLVDVSLNWGKVPSLHVSFCNSQSYVWNGSSSSNWAVAANWTPTGIPTSSDDVTIVSAPNQTSLDASRSVRNCTMTSGQLALSTFSLTITGQASLKAGQVSGGNLVCNGTVTTLGDASAGPTLATTLSVNSATLTLQHTTFTGAATLTKTGSSNDASAGGNTFQTSLSLSNSGSGKLQMGVSAADVFQGPVTLTTTGTGGLFLAHSSSGSLLQADVTLNSVAAGGIAFGAGSGSCQLQDSYHLLVSSSGFTAGELVLKGFSQVGATAQSLTLTGTAGLRIGSGSTFNGAVNFTVPQLYLDGAQYNAPALFTKTGAGTNNCLGGNTFQKKVNIVNQATGNSPLNMATVADDIIH